MSSKERPMTIGDVRKWLGLYFLIVSVGIGAFLILAGGERSFLLPISDLDASAAFEIVVPVLVSQLMLVFQFFAGDSWDPKELKQPAKVPAWAIKAPAILVAAIFVLGVILVAAGNKRGWGPDGNQFRHLVTFCVSVLNSTTALLVGRFFKRATKKKKEEAQDTRASAA